jgi:hypothetical protein
MSDGNGLAAEEVAEPAALSAIVIGVALVKETVVLVASTPSPIWLPTLDGGSGRSYRAVADLELRLAATKVKEISNTSEQRSNLRLRGAQINDRANRIRASCK